MLAKIFYFGMFLNIFIFSLELLSFESDFLYYDDGKSQGSNEFDISNNNTSDDIKNSASETELLENIANELSRKIDFDVHDDQFDKDIIEKYSKKLAGKEITFFLNHYNASKFRQLYLPMDSDDFEYKPLTKDDSKFYQADNKSPYLDLKTYLFTLYFYLYYGHSVGTFRKTLITLTPKEINLLKKNYSYNAFYHLDAIKHDQELNRLTPKEAATTLVKEIKKLLKIKGESKENSEIEKHLHLILADFLRKNYSINHYANEFLKDESAFIFFETNIATHVLKKEDNKTFFLKYIFYNKQSNIITDNLSPKNPYDNIIFIGISNNKCLVRKNGGLVRVNDLEGGKTDINIFKETIYADKYHILNEAKYEELFFTIRKVIEEINNASANSKNLIVFCNSSHGIAEDGKFYIYLNPDAEGEHTVYPESTFYRVDFELIYNNFNDISRLCKVLYIIDSCGTNELRNYKCLQSFGGALSSDKPLTVEQYFLVSNKPENKEHSLGGFRDSDKIANKFGIRKFNRIGAFSAEIAAAAISSEKIIAIEKLLANIEKNVIGEFYSLITSKPQILKDAIDAVISHEEFSSTIDNQEGLNDFILLVEKCNKYRNLVEDGYQFRNILKKESNKYSFIAFELLVIYYFEYHKLRGDEVYKTLSDRFIKPKDIEGSPIKSLWQLVKNVHYPHLYKLLGSKSELQILLK